MAGDAKQVSLVHVLAPVPPSSAHAAAVEVVGKGALDNLGTQLEGLAGDPGLETHAVVGIATSHASSLRVTQNVTRSRAYGLPGITRNTAYRITSSGLVLPRPSGLFYSAVDNSLRPAGITPLVWGTTTYSRIGLALVLIFRKS